MCAAELKALAPKKPSFKVRAAPTHQELGQWMNCRCHGADDVQTERPSAPFVPLCRWWHTPPALLPPPNCVWPDGRDGDIGGGGLAQSEKGGNKSGSKKDLICLQCRKTGHTMRRCPEVSRPTTDGLELPSRPPLVPGCESPRATRRSSLSPAMSAHGVMCVCQRVLSGRSAAPFRSQPWSRKLGLE